jgi:ATP-dependent Clp protease ATP-binding subunit ClpA
MFERYTEQARRVVFFARYEASVFGSDSIDTEHLLLGLLREDGGLVGRILQRSQVNRRVVQERIEARQLPGVPTSTAVDIPLSPAAKHVLERAADEAERLNHAYIGLEALLLGLLGEQGAVAADILAARGLQIEEVREEVRLQSKAPADPHQPRKNAFHQLLEFVAELEARQAGFQVSSFRQEALRVTVPGPDVRWVVTFFPDGRVAVEASTRPGEVEGEAALSRLLDRLGPSHRTDTDG